MPSLIHMSAGGLAGDDLAIIGIGRADYAATIAAMRTAAR